MATAAPRCGSSPKPDGKQDKSIVNRDVQVSTDILLLGGGHAHVHVIKAFAERPLPGVRVTLVTRDLETPYSGMLPGVVAGLYAPEEAHIDLVRLAAVTGTRLIHAQAMGLDRGAKRVSLAGRPPVAYDILSIDVGITPDLASIPGAAEHGIAVKPIGTFLAKLEHLRARCRVGEVGRIAMIGGGAAGVELLLSLRTRLHADAARDGRELNLSFTLVTDEALLASHNVRVQRTFRKHLATAGVEVRERCAVTAIKPGFVVCRDGKTIAAEAVLLATDAAPPGWFEESDLARDSGGFLAVTPTLQVANDPDIFAAGDCAGLVETPREKAGVYAVRAGPPLAVNLARRARGKTLRPWQPQRRHLALISTGARYAVASRGPFKAEGVWLWAVKDWIDRRWIDMYRHLERMRMKMPAAKPLPNGAEMRCGGCAAKVGPATLSRALARLGPPAAANDVVIGLGAPDDAAVLMPPPAGNQITATVDLFRSFIDDPYLFGEIAANHALNDIFAMGGTPLHALAVAMVPYGRSDKTEETLFQMLAGARACLDREKVTLAGGHSAEGADVAMGFSVFGAVAPDRILRKAGLQPGNALVLSKPIGTGIMFAALMRGRVTAASIARAIAGMRQSSRAAAQILAAHGATAMTDVTGFGLAGHLGEMLRASGAAAELDLAAIPLYPGAHDLAAEGIASTLLPENLASGGIIRGDLNEAARTLLFDPQTAGGLLAGIPQSRAAQCVAALTAARYADAAIIGSVREAEEEEPGIVTKNDLRRAGSL
jgi:selenide, water dikinase